VKRIMCNLEKYTRALFHGGTEIAAKKGLILVDTKYEFGKKGGKIYLIDEIPLLIRQDILFEGLLIVSKKMRPKTIVKRVRGASG